MFSILLLPIYSDFEKKKLYCSYIFERKKDIIIPMSEMMNEITIHLLSLLIGEEKVYLSFNTIYRTSTDTTCEDILYPVEFLNFLKFNNVLHHELRLKKDGPIMLL